MANKNCVNPQGELMCCIGCGRDTSSFDGLCCHCVGTETSFDVYEKENTGRKHTKRTKANRGEGLSTALCRPYGSPESAHERVNSGAESQNDRGSMQ